LCIATDSVFATAGYNGSDWMWVGIHMVIVDWIGLGQSASGLVGLDLAKWTHVQLCNVHLHDVPQQHHVSDKTTRTYY